MLIIGLACLAAAIGMIVFLVGDRTPATAAAPSAAEPEAPGPPALVDARPSAFAPVFARLGRLATRLSASGYQRKLQHKLDLAGNPRGWDAQRVLALKGLGLLLGAGLGALAGSRSGLLVLVLAVGLGAAGFFLPDVWVRNLGERRHGEIVRGLPDAIDMMTVCVEAGLGFDAALARVARTMTGPVPHEFARLLQEMQFGLSRTEALRALNARTDVSELRIFATALVQASELGISVGDVLREQSREMRIRRRQRAEERAQKLPVKLLMPLISCLLPALFVAALGPAVINIVHSFSSGSGFL